MKLTLNRNTQKMTLHWLSAFTSLSAILISTPSLAFLSASAFTQASVQIYGVYTTADAGCQNGFVASDPFNPNPPTTDFAAAVPSTLVSTVKVSTPINCVLILMNNAVSGTVAPGNYTSTSSYTEYTSTACAGAGCPSTTPDPVLITTPPVSDSVCNLGLTGALNVLSYFQPVFPPAGSLPMTDIANNNLTGSLYTAPPGSTTPGTITLVPSTPASPTPGSSGVIIPIYLSTNSAASNPSTPFASAPPQVSGDAARGIYLPPVSATAAGYRLSLVVSKLVGASQGTVPTCNNNIGNLAFAFEAQ